MEKVSKSLKTVGVPSMTLLTVFWTARESYAFSVSHLTVWKCLFEVRTADILMSETILTVLWPHRKVCLSCFSSDRVRMPVWSIHLLWDHLPWSSRVTCIYICFVSVSPPFM